MIRAMYSGISGMKVNQTKLDVTGNNIANVGTTSFKYSRTRFQDMLSQNMSEAVGPGRNTGGVNGRQVGLGVQVAGIDTIVTQGMMQPTSRPLDAAVDGEGYFIVSRGALPDSNAGGITVNPAQHTMSGGNMEINFTRDGAFALDNQGNLLTSDGYRVLGYAIKEKSGPNSSTISVDYDANGTVNFVDADSAGELEVANSSLVPLRIPDSVHVNATKIVGSGENMTYTGNGRIKWASGTDTVIIDAPKVNTGSAAYKGKKDLGINIVAEKNASGTLTWYSKIGDTIVGSAAFGTTDITINLASAEAILGFDKGTLGSGTINITNIGDTDISSADAMKYSWTTTIRAEGDKKIRSFSFEKEGLIKGVLDDGSVAVLGQLALASFKNPAGLKKLGKNLLQNTANTGQPIVRSGVNCDPQYDNSDGYGDIMQGALEMSNVDLAEQFTDMIVTTRSFQASGKMITTGDEILQDIINLKR